jgi:excisionase family DNA binding protein
MATEILTVEQVANEMQVSEKTVYTWIKAGRLKATNIGTKRKANYRIRRADLDEFLSQGAVTEEGGE